MQPTKPLTGSCQSGFNRIPRVLQQIRKDGRQSRRSAGRTSRRRRRRTSTSTPLPPRMKRSQCGVFHHLFWFTQVVLPTSSVSHEGQSCAVCEPSSRNRKRNQAVNGMLYLPDGSVCTFDGAPDEPLADVRSIGVQLALPCNLEPIAVYVKDVFCFTQVGARTSSGFRVGQSCDVYHALWTRQTSMPRFQNTCYEYSDLASYEAAEPVVSGHMSLRALRDWQ